MDLQVGHQSIRVIVVLTTVSLPYSIEVLHNGGKQNKRIHKGKKGNNDRSGVEVHSGN